MEEEMKMIHKDRAWRLIKRPSNKNVIGLKWMFRTKLKTDSSINKLKATLVVKGYVQIYGIN